jgi:ABC-type multidrug transport system ATPase subunit
MIAIEKLNKVYTRAKVLDDISFTIPQGVYGLLGPNGAGKTTLLHILVTLLAPTSGTVKIGDYLLGKDDHMIRRMIGFLPQEFGMYNKLTAWEYLDLVGTFKGLTDHRKRRTEIDEVLEKVNLEGASRKKIKGLSGGMKRRLGIAQALLGDPPILIADEPTVGLDVEERRRFRSLLKSWGVEKTIVLSTHIVSDIEDTCERIAILKTGRLLYDGLIEHLLERLNGRVWHGVIEKGMLPGLEERTIILSQNQVREGVEVRVVSEDEEKPFPEARLVSPSLEDAYLFVTGGGKLV